MNEILIRKIVVLILLIFGTITMVTGIILYFMPHGKHSKYFTFLGLSKEKYKTLHLFSALITFIGALVHIYLNRKALKTYFKLK